MKTLIVLAALTAAPQEAGAAWLYCSARGTTADGPVAVLASVADIGPAPPSRLAPLQQRLASYVATVEPGIGGLQAQCAVRDDEIVAASTASRQLNNEARRVGWDHVLVLQPSDWLPASLGDGGILQP